MPTVGWIIAMLYRVTASRARFPTFRMIGSAWLWCWSAATRSPSWSCKPDETPTLALTPASGEANNQRPRLSVSPLGLQGISKEQQ